MLQQIHTKIFRKKTFINIFNRQFFPVFLFILEDVVKFIFFKIKALVTRMFHNWNDLFIWTASKTSVVSIFIRFSLDSNDHVPN